MVGAIAWAGGAPRGERHEAGIAGQVEQDFEPNGHVGLFSP